MQALPASTDDAAFLFTLANEPTVRAASLSTQPLTWSRHATWLTRLLKRKDAIAFVLWDGPVEQGWIRAERQDGETVVSIALIPEARGRHEGRDAIRYIARKARPLGEPVCAYIKVGNIASQKAFEAAGFKRSRSTPTAIRYVFR